MPDAARTLAVFSALLLLASGAIWGVWLRGPLLERLDGRRRSNTGPAQVVIQVLVLAFCFSAVAAVLAIIGWIIH